MSSLLDDLALALTEPISRRRALRLTAPPCEGRQSCRYGYCL